MSNFLFLRVGLFENISKELIKRNHKCYNLAFQLGELLSNAYTSQEYALFKVKKGNEYQIDDDELLKFPIFQFQYLRKILNTKPKEEIIQEYKKYMYVIEEYIEDNNIDIICVYNGSNWIEQLAIYIAKEYSLKVLYFEEGYFRPYTITCDDKGINYNSSIPKNREFYKKIKVNSSKFDKYLTKPINEELINLEKKDSLSLILKKLIGIIGYRLRLQPQVYIHNSFYDYLKIYLQKKLIKFKDMDQIKLPENYIFVPFQVHSDTQILFHSPQINDMLELVDIVVKYVNKFNKATQNNYKVVFKEHPKDITRISYNKLFRKYKDNDNIIFLKYFDTHKLIKESKLVITINSTVGIEALMNYKKVITLGNAFYNIDGIVNHCNNIDKLDTCIKETLNSNLNRELVNKFLYYLRFEYLIEGFWGCNNEITSTNIADKIETLI
ncbi:hypothetical protein [Orenia marismortui]|uniref:Capsule polysaccharide modification protein KpsS n=1 Tax=Orenia marismortui TaxID=46469 RepID=A0A4R8HLM4_9FIRM|nr:hypothetical protein [Orenia marismortui]TDX59274.1 capsule polysaccharide modification protein KpsS [Orenia marismortui]